MGKEQCGYDSNVKPIYCDPQYVVHDTFTPRFIPVVHPVIHVNRQNIVNVPRHMTQHSEQNEVVDPGLPDKCDVCSRPKCPGWFW